MKVIDNLDLFVFIKASESEINKDWYVYFSTEPYMNLLFNGNWFAKKIARIDYAANEISTDFSNEVRALKPQTPKMACDIKKQIVQEYLFNSVLRNAQF